MEVKITFFDLLHAGRFLKQHKRKWSSFGRRVFLAEIYEEPICPVCGAHQLNYLRTMGEECWHGHATQRLETENRSLKGKR